MISLRCFLLSSHVRGSALFFRCCFGRFLCLCSFLLLLHQLLQFSLFLQQHLQNQQMYNKFILISFCFFSSLSSSNSTCKINKMNNKFILFPFCFFSSLSSSNRTCYINNMNSKFDRFYCISFFSLSSSSIAHAESTTL